jgi:hypothetical protein
MNVLFCFGMALGMDGVRRIYGKGFGGSLRQQATAFPAR